VSKQVTTIPKPTVRTSVGLRDTLFEELDSMRLGDSSPQRASAAARLAMTIVKSAMLEVQFQRSVGSTGQGKNVRAAPVLLGSAP
jgi:hypothetical protein